MSKAVIYARVSSAGERQDTERQVEVPFNPNTEVNAKGWCAFLEMRNIAAQQGLQDMSLEEINEIIHEVRYKGKTTP